MNSNTHTQSPVAGQVRDDLLAGLPASLQHDSTTISPIAVGNSGAGVYLVTDDRNRWVLKRTSAEEPVEQWRTNLEMQRRATAARIAPAVIHADEQRRTVLSEHIADKSFAALVGNPDTRSHAIDLLGRMIRSLHEIAPLPSQNAVDPIAVLDNFKHGLKRASQSASLPIVVEQAWNSLSETKVPVVDRAPVLCHNDINPSNIVYDGRRVVMLDWQTAATNNPYYDLATVALFLRLDHAATLQLLSAYDNAVANQITPSFTWHRKVAAVLSGTAFLLAARSRGYTTAASDIVDTAIPSLAELYAQLRAGTLTLGTPETQWIFGLVLLNESLQAFHDA